MLVDPKNTSVSTKQYVALVVAHELAHMWFGNLVTMRWWTDLWLNEGFASWVEYVAIDTLFPEWQMWTQFIVDEQQQAMKLDSLENTHPIEVPVKHPDEIRTIFDGISYGKGASVIHQLNAFMGNVDFRKGLHTYLKRHAYKNTDTKDLWDALSDASGKDIASFMHDWTSLPGFPIVTATADKDNTITLEQKRFYSDPTASPITQQRWPVPLLATSTNKTLLQEQHTTIQKSDDDVFLLNSGRKGFYRTTYDDVLLEKIVGQIANGGLSPLDRLGLLSDMLETSKSGHIPTHEVLSLLENYKNEDNAVVWTTIASLLGSIRLVHGSDELRSLMKPYIRNLAASEYARLGWDKKKSDTYFDQIERPIILGLLAGADEPDVVAHCLELFTHATNVDDVSPELRDSVTTVEMRLSLDIDPDTRSIVFSTAARLGDEATFDKLLKLHNETHLSEEKLTFAAALTDFKQPELIARALDTIRTDVVRLQDVSYWIAYSFMNHHARTATWQWLQKNWQWLSDNMGKDLSFYRMPLYAARVQHDKNFIDEYRSFFEPIMTPGLERSYKQGLEMISWQSDWRSRDQKSVTNYFKKHQP
jgi:puromycin-sensitive aminopeptidase